MHFIDKSIKNEAYSEKILFLQTQQMIVELRFYDAKGYCEDTAMLYVFDLMSNLQKCLSIEISESQKQKITISTGASKDLLLQFECDDITKEQIEAWGFGFVIHYSINNQTTKIIDTLVLSVDMIVRLNRVINKHKKSLIAQSYWEKLLREARVS